MLLQMENYVNMIWLLLTDQLKTDALWRYLRLILSELKLSNSDFQNKSRSPFDEFAFSKTQDLLINL